MPRAGVCMRELVKIPMVVIGAMVLCAGAPAWADMSLTPSSGRSFQDERTFQMADHTALLTELDGQWAPLSIAGSRDYYATGSSYRWWDAVSLSFDLSPVGGVKHIVSAVLRFYTQQGTYVDTTWHHYELLEGEFNPTHEDDHAVTGAWPGLVDFGDYGSNGVVGWVEAPVPTSWITTDIFDVTLRLWNARIDKIELDVVSAPLPGAVILSLLGFGSTGLLARLRRRGTTIDAS
jgi:hypothetical protein